MIKSAFGEAHDDDARVWLAHRPSVAADVLVNSTAAQCAEAHSAIRLCAMRSGVYDATQAQGMGVSCCPASALHQRTRTAHERYEPSWRR